MTHLRHLIDHYDLFVLDLWGVIHDGVTAFPHALDVLTQLARHHKTVAFISNAPRREIVIAAQLQQLGVESHFYDAIFSSGEQTWQQLHEQGVATWGQHCYHIGPPRDDHLLEGLPFTPTDDIHTADFILNSGPWGDDHRVSDYHDILHQAHARALPMLCANPDITVVRGGSMMICAGALADFYEQLGSPVTYHGKPHPAIYDALQHHYATISPSRIIAIGDSISTDIQGAHNAAIDAILITSGIHHEESQDDIKTKLAGHSLTPRAIMTQLIW